MPFFKNTIHSSVLLFFLLVLASAKCSGQDFKPMPQPEKFVAAYRAQVEQQTTLKADYVQLRHLTFMKDPSQSTGVFFAAGQSKIRWEQVQPKSHILLMNEGTAYVIADGKTETYDLEKNRQFRTINEMMTRVMSGDISDNTDFEVTFLESDKEVKVILVPTRKMMKKFIGSIELIVDKSSYLLNRMTMTEADGNATELIFSNQKANIPLEMSIFEPTK
ncbi:MAG: outer membrane lipoprotein carrier protein LolA [Flavobacteriales bacterium]|nr:outer membrane lipoprotein carrier protein LolA [Flavobacteriales bacterium]